MAIWAKIQVLKNRVLRLEKKLMLRVQGHAMNVVAI